MRKDGDLPGYEKIVQANRDALKSAMQKLAEQKGFYRQNALKPSPYQEVLATLQGDALTREHLPSSLIDLIDTIYPDQEPEIHTIIAGENYIDITTKKDPGKDTDFERMGVLSIYTDPLREVVRDRTFYIFPSTTPIRYGVREWSMLEFATKTFAANPELVEGEIVNPDVIGEIARMIPEPLRKPTRKASAPALNRWIGIGPNFQELARSLNIKTL